MKSKFITGAKMAGLLAICLLVSCTSKSKTESFNPVDYVDPMIGSGGHGHVFVGASVPFGAVQIGPNNIFKGWDWCSGYHYSDSLIIGFSQLHLSGTGIGDLGDVLIMPYSGDAILERGSQEFPHNGYLSTFKHENEAVRPGYYTVKMDNGVSVELTASERVGYHRYQFPKEKEAHIVIDLKEGLNDRTTEASIVQVDEYTLKGYRNSSGWAKEQQVYFAIKSSVPLGDLNIFDAGELVDEKFHKGAAIKGLIIFNEAPSQVELKVGISPVSTEMALANIEHEIPDWNFEKVAETAKSKWNAELSKIKIETADVHKKRTFYTALFHSMIHPSLFNDYNGSYQGADNQVYQSDEFDNYSVFSTWDTYRAEHPLFTLIQPERMNDFVNSMLAIYDQQGHLPIWHLNGYETGTMVGISSIQVVAEAYLKGFRGFDVEKAWEAVRNTAMSDIRGLNYLQEFKPIHSDDPKVGRAVAQAMELSVADGSIALMAKAMGKDEDFDYFSKRARNYQLFFDPAVKFFHGINSDGTWNQPYDPLKSKHAQATDYAEGNGWQYLWLAPQDVKGLISLLGGEDQFNARLDSFFVLESKDESEVLVDLTGLIGQYAHGNEPSHHIAYLYAYSGLQWKTAEKVDYIMNEFYNDTHDGIIGNEDCGQMSAWYIFSSLGFYPVFPASGEYVFGSPLFDRAEINLGQGKKLTVKASNRNARNKYIQSVKWNGKPYSHVYINHKNIAQGGELEFVMGDQPNTTFGQSAEDRPQF